MNLGRIYAIAARKFSSLRRDKRMFGFIVIMPAIQILLFGWAVGGPPTDLDVVVVDDGTDSARSAVFIGYLEGSDSLEISYSDSNESAYASVEDGDAWAVIHLLPAVAVPWQPLHHLSPRLVPLPGGIQIFGFWWGWAGRDGFGTPSHQKPGRAAI